MRLSGLRVSRRLLTGCAQLKYRWKYESCRVPNCCCGCCELPCKQNKHNEIYTQRAQTSTKGNISTKRQRDLGFQSGFLDKLRFGCGCGVPDRCQNIVDLLSCQHQSFRRVSWKSTGECMRNANKSPTMARGVEKWSGIRIRDRITIKS